MPPSLAARVCAGCGKKGCRAELACLAFMANGTEERVVRCAQEMMARVAEAGEADVDVDGALING